MPRIAGGKDIITQPLYDTAKYALAGSAAPIAFFQTPRGQGTTLFGTGGKNLSDTNMRTAGSLPSPWTFEIMTIYVDLICNSAALTSQTPDIALYARSANLVLNIGSKQFLEIPVRNLPSGTGVEGFSDAVASHQSGHLGNADPRAVYVMSRTITLLENENFDVQVTAPDAIALTADLLVRVNLGGELSRSIQ